MPSLAIAELNLPFKGSRNYLHSTDLFPALMKLAQEDFSQAAFIEFLTIRRQVCHRVQVRFDLPANAFGSFRIRQGSDHYKGWLVETGEAVRERVPYDEPTISSAAITGSGFARLDKTVPGYTVFEQLVVLMKAVSAQVAPQHWWLCQMDFCCALTEAWPLEFRLRRTVSDRFLIGDIHQSGGAIGSASGIAERAS